MTKHGLVWLSGLLLLTPSTMLSQSPSAVAPQVGNGTQQAVLNKYCMGCHNDKVKTADFSLTGTDVANVATNTDLWERVLRKLEGRQMMMVLAPK